MRPQKKNFIQPFNRGKKPQCGGQVLDVGKYVGSVLGSVLVPSFNEEHRSWCRWQRGELAKAVFARKGGLGQIQLLNWMEGKMADIERRIKKEG